MNGAKYASVPVCSSSFEATIGPQVRFLLKEEIKAALQNRLIDV
jgi:hypothetical protein